MLIKPVYESLPFTYMLVGSLSIFVLAPNYAIIASVLVYLYGAYIYNLRSKNRRTDVKRMRKSGLMPEPLYGLMPFIYVLIAVSLYGFYPRDSSTFFALCLTIYGGYLFLSRLKYRHHRLPRGINQ